MQNIKSISCKSYRGLPECYQMDSGTWSVLSWVVTTGAGTLCPACKKLQVPQPLTIVFSSFSCWTPNGRGSDPVSPSYIFLLPLLLHRIHTGTDLKLTEDMGRFLLTSVGFWSGPWATSAYSSSGDCIWSPMVTNSWVQCTHPAQHSVVGRSVCIAITFRS